MGPSCCGQTRQKAWDDSDLKATATRPDLLSDLCNLHGLVAVQIPHLGCFVTGRCENFAPVLLGEAHNKWFNILACDGLLTLGFMQIRGRTSLQHASNTGPVCICWALGTVCPLSCTSQQRTWHQKIRDHGQRLSAIADVYVTLSSWTTYVIGPRSSNKKVPWQGRGTESQTTNAVIRRGRHLNILFDQTAIMLD